MFQPRILLILLAAMIFCAQEPSGVEVVKSSWSKIRIGWERDPFGGPLENFDEMRSRARNERRVATGGGERARREAKADEKNLAARHRVYCLEGATRQAAEERMRNVVIEGTAVNSLELAKRIVRDGITDKVIFFIGNIRRPDLPDFLRENGISLEEMTVYNTVETPVELDEDYDGVLFFSPSSVRSFFTNNALPAVTVCFAIGGTTAAAVSALAQNRVITSPAPSVAKLVETAIFYFDNINCYE